MSRPSHMRPLTGVGLPPLPGEYNRRQRPTDVPPPLGRHRRPRPIDIPPPQQLEQQIPSPPPSQELHVIKVPIEVPPETIEGTVQSEQFEPQPEPAINIGKRSKKIVGPIWDPKVRPTLETAREAEAEGLHRVAASAYRGAVEIYREIGAKALPDTTVAEQLICGFGLLRCGDETKIGDYTSTGQEVLDSVIPIILDSDFALFSLRVQAERLSSPLIEGAFRGRDVEEIREINFGLFLDPQTRDLAGEI